MTLIDSVLTTSLADSYYVDYNVGVDTIYYYRITAVDSAGNESLFSNEVNAFPAAADIAVSPTALDFGVIQIPDDKTLTINVANLGNWELLVDSTEIIGSDSIQFEMVSGQEGFNIPIGGNPHSIRIRFAPTSGGIKNAQLRIISNDLDENPLDVNLTGTAIKPEISISPDSLNFGNVVVNSDSLMTLTVSNQGQMELIIDSTKILGPDSLLFTFIGGHESFSIPPGGNPQDIVVQFSPIAIGFKSAILRIFSNDIENNPLDVPISGKGVLADIFVFPDSLGFGNVLVLEDSVLNIDITNRGGTDLIVDSTVISGTDTSVFSLISGLGRFVLRPDDPSYKIEIQFSPTELGFKSAIARIYSNDPDDNPFDIPLTGTGVQPEISVGPELLQFGSVYINYDKILNVTIGNLGDGNLKISSAVIVGSDSQHFSVLGGQDNFVVSPFSIPDTIKVQFAPNSVGSKIAALQITSNDPVDSLIQIALLGSGIAFVPEADGPIISNVNYPNGVNLNTTIPLSADVSDLSAINEVTIFYKISGAPVYTKDQMNLQSGSTYTANIPAVNVTEKGIEFYIFAQDGYLNSSISSTYYIKTILTTGLTNTTAQPAGNTLSYYRIFSLPIDLDDPSPATFIESNPNLGNYDQVQYRLYDVENGNLKEYPNIGNFLPGKGFLFITKISNLKLSTSKGKSIDSSKPFNINLPAGWSLIGNPYYFNIPFDSLSASTGYFELHAFIADSGWVPNTSGLEPWKGYAIWLGQAGDFIINPSVEGLNKPSTYYSVAFNDQTNWLIQITANNGFSIDRFNFVGQNENAEDIYDRLDLHEAPRIGKRVSIMFISENTEEHMLTTDIRATSDDGHIWDITCLTDPESEYVSLSFKGIDKIPKDFDVFVLEQATNSAYNLRNNSDMKFASNNVTEKKFKLITGTKEFLNSLKHDVELYPKEFDLLQNFPNPFNSSTTIRYQLPIPGEVKLGIYNILGQKVEALINNHQPAGYHNFIWNITSKSVQIASGVYFLRLTAKGVNGIKFEKTKKMLYVK